MIKVSSHASLPLLAWILNWHQGAGSLVCGRGVEIHDDSWFEGVWGGDFERWDFDLAADVFGSGGKCTEGGLLLVPPSHPLEFLFLMRDGDAVVVANSLAFLSAHTGNRLKQDRFDYAEHFLATLDGIEHIPFEIQGERGPITVFSYYNMEVAPDGELRLIDKPATAPPRDFLDYTQRLEQTLTTTIANGQSPGRRYPFAPLVTLSAGYDSPACAILAKNAGSTNTITFRTSLTREGSTQEDDSGVEIGRRLGLQVREFARTLPEGPDSEAMTQFYCDGGLGGEVFWGGFAEELPNTAVITGIPGGSTWMKTHASQTVFEKSDCGGLGLGEFRRRMGFAHIPAPYILSTHVTKIQAIGRSTEMQPWSVGGDYNKPIPRRLIEQAGIPRQMFGQTKYGHSFRAWYPDHWPAWFHEQFQQHCTRLPKSLAWRPRYLRQWARYQFLRFSCERRFLKHLARRLSVAGKGEGLILPVLNSLSWLLRLALRPFNPPHYKIIIRMHPRYTCLLNWANDDAARHYALSGSETERAHPNDTIAG